MASAAAPEPKTAGETADPRSRGTLPWLARLPTGAKLFILLSLCLLPLALIAIAAILQTTRLTDAEARARLRVTSTESARAIAVELSGDLRALQAAAEALAYNGLVLSWPEIVRLARERATPTAEQAELF